MKKVAIVCKYIPHYRLSVFNELTRNSDLNYEIIADSSGREGIKTIPLKYGEILPENGGIKWIYSKSIYYKKSLQIWQTNVVSKIFSKDYSLFILDGAASHISTWLFAILCRVTNKKVLFWTHGFKGTDKGLKKKIRTFFFDKLPHGMLLYSNYSRDVMIEAGFDSSKLFVIGNSLNYNAQKQIRDNLLRDKVALSDLKQTIFSNNNKTIIFIGRLLSNKKIDEIIKSLYELRKQSIYLNCIIIGNGPSRNSLFKLICKFDLQKQVYFANDLYEEEEIAKLFLISDLMVSPGNVGLNCIHSLIYGVPVLTHDSFKFQNPEFEAINSNDNGLFYQYKNYDDLTYKIRSWFSEEHPDLLNKCEQPIKNRFNPLSHAGNIHYAVQHILKKDINPINTKKKLLVFHPALAPYRIDQFNTLSELFDLKVVFTSNNVWNHKFDQSKLLTQLRFPYAFLLNGFFYKGRVFRFGILKTIREFNPDLIIGFEYSFTTQYLLILRLLGIISQKIGSTIDDNISICNHVQSKIRLLARNYSVNKLDFIVLLSNEVATFYQSKFNIDSSKIIISPIIQNPNRLRKDVALLESTANEYQLKFRLKDKKVLLFVGRFITEKALPSFISQIEEILNKNDNIKFVLVGDGNDRINIEKVIKQFNLDSKVILPGRYEGVELHAWYLCASGFVLPSTYEPFGAVVNEALIFGLPVLCSKNAGASSLINESLGLIFDPTDELNVNEKITDFIEMIEITSDICLAKRESLMTELQNDIDNQWKKLNND